MDDLFFTDRNKNNGSDKPRQKRNTRDQFIDETDYNSENSRINANGSSDLFSGAPKNKFSVNIPDDDYPAPKRDNIYNTPPRDRTPKGRPVAPRPYNEPEHFDMYSDSSEIPYTAQGDNASPKASRSPQGKPVSVTQGSVSPKASSQAPKKPNYLADNSKSGKKKKKKKRGSVGKKVAATIFALIILCLCAVFAYGYSLLGKINYDTDTIKKNQYISESKLASDSKVKNILFIGSDYRSGEVTGMRSDTMMLFSIDKAHKKIKLTSFLRDSYVCIPSTGKYRKLNASCSSGGAQLVIDTIEYNFKVKIDNYILVDFEAFTKLIDLMGGLTVKGVTEKEAKYLRDTVKIVYAKKGTNKFSGAAALWYCRIRYLDDDFHRTERQRKVISALVSQVSHTSPAKLMQIMQEVLPLITTDISRNELLSLGMGAVASYLRYDTVQHQVPADGTWSNARIYGEGSVLKMDIDENAKLLKQFIYKDKSSKKSNK